jgi:hypothetical protein
MALADRAASTAITSTAKPVVARFEGKLILHTFMSRPSKLADGSYSKREATGEVALVYRICPVLADGTVSTSGAIWLWLEPQRKASEPTKLDPTMLRAFRASLAGIGASIDALEAVAVEDGDWEPLVAPKVAAPAKKGLAAKAAAEADGAKAVDLDTAVDALPF